MENLNLHQFKKVEQENENNWSPKSKSAPDGGQLATLQQKANAFAANQAVVQHKKEEDEDSKKTQLKKEGEKGTSIDRPTQMKKASSSTTGMPEAVQSKMENSFETDFSSVNIHKDSSSATDMGALAYAQGNDVHFAPGQYNPNSQSGQELLGHELTHVVQQRQGRVQGSQNKGGDNINSDPELEKEADLEGEKAARGEKTSVIKASTGIQKKDPEEDDELESRLFFGSSYLHTILNTKKKGGPVIGPGSQGEDVVRIQQALYYLFPDLKVKGLGNDVFGDKTKKAVIRFQKLYKDLENDGYVGYLTLAKLDHVVRNAEVVADEKLEKEQRLKAQTPNFSNLIFHMSFLESLAKQDGYGFTKVITAFRKLYYNSKTQEKKYAGATVGGGAWNILIPGAQNTGLPPSWAGNSEDVKSALSFMKKNQEIKLGKDKVDIGHVLTGLDAKQHPQKISLAGGIVKMRSNQEAATYIGDLGSVVGEYILKEGKKQSMYDICKKLNPKLEQYFNSNLKPADIKGNIDSYTMPLDKSQTLAQNFFSYYSSKDSGATKRFSHFAKKLGMFDSKMKVNASVKKDFKEEIMNSSMAYVASKGKKADLMLIMDGPNFYGTSHFDLYSNVSGWTADIFFRKVKEGMKNEK